MKEVYLISKNKTKILAAKDVFDKYKIELKGFPADYPEIQSASSLEIARHTVCQAIKDTDLPVIREDHSIFLRAINGPGPYASYFEKQIPAEDLLKIMNNFIDRSGYFEVASVYGTTDKQLLEYVFQVPFKISKEIRGVSQDGWSGLIILDGEKRTLAEYPEEERTHIWGRGYEKIARHIVKNKG